MIITTQNGRAVYSDGETTEQRMLALAQQYPEAATADFISDSSEYTINNTFSAVRHNLLNWYPFKQGADILEVGAGMGAMTGLLCDVAESVTALEMSETRAEVIRARYPNRKNLSVLSADITTWHTQQHFDYIVVVGVLEYASTFGKGAGDEPQISFLEALRRRLKPGGLVLLAIENRFGLKYWLGAAEDHLQQPFVGIAGYQQNGTPKTFTKADLTRLFSQAGFEAQRYYYVLPDYKFPTAIFTDDSLPSTHELLNIGFTYSKGSSLLANERDLYPAILDEGLFPSFANSYLMEAGAETIPEAHIIRVSARGESHPQYRVVTAIHSDGTVVKQPADPRAAAHIKKTYQNGVVLQQRGVAQLPATLDDSCLTTALCSEPLASAVFCDALNSGNWAQATNIIDQLRQALEQSSDITEVPSPLMEDCPGLAGQDTGPFMAHGYMDLTLYNAFWRDEGLLFFDQEWDFSGLPLRFLLYYGLKITFERNPGHSLFPFVEILRYIGVGAAEAAAWDELEARVWQQTVTRTGDIYGADGYCNRYNDRLTLDFQQKSERQAHAQREAALEEREALSQGQLRELEAQLAAQNALLDEREARIARQAQQLNAQGSDIADLRETARHHDEILASRSWRYGQKGMKVVRFFLPAGSRRSRFVGGLLRLPLRLYRWLRYGTAAPANADESAPVAENTASPLVNPEPEPPSISNYSRLEVPTAKEPVVSIIIPVYNEFDYTYHCIESIVNSDDGTPYEIILADDVSTDCTSEIEQVISGLTIVRNTENLRFLRNCNHAATYARGEYLIFLNNDTIVHSRWLYSLVDVLNSDSTAGLVGSKLTYPDGRLQEAGGIIWRDGSGWNYGHGQDAEASEYNYLKEVDYLSGCSIMVRRTLWEQLGGFDTRFAPAYYEDADLAFSIRQLGYRVIYQPLSVVTHYEGVSNGTDIDSGQKKYQVENQKKLAEKWEAELQHHYPNGKHVLRARDRSRYKRHLLLVDHYVPTFDQDAGGRSIYEYVRMFLHQGYHVTLLPDNFNRSEFYAEHYQQMGVEVLYGVWYAEHWQDWVRENADELDLIFLSRPHISVKYIDFLKENTNAPILYYGHDLHFMREQRQYEITKDPVLPASIERWREIELGLMRKADYSFYISYVEEEYIKSIDPSLKVRSLPGFIYTDIKKEQYQIKNRQDILFVGGFGHPPNADGITWFVNEVFPLVLQHEPKMRLHIVGSHPPEEILALDSSNVRVHGFVSTDILDELYRKCRLCIAPLRYGAGMKGKVVEAMAKGLPVVTTSIGAEGIERASEFLAIADDSEGFARHVYSLYGDDVQLGVMCQRAYESIERDFCIAKVAKALEDSLAQILASK